MKAPSGSFLASKSSEHKNPFFFVVSFSTKKKRAGGGGKRPETKAMIWYTLED